MTKTIQRGRVFATTTAQLIAEAMKSLNSVRTHVPIGQAPSTYQTAVKNLSILPPHYFFSTPFEKGMEKAVEKYKEKFGRPPRYFGDLEAAGFDPESFVEGSPANQREPRTTGHKPTDKAIEAYKEKIGLPPRYVGDLEAAGFDPDDFVEDSPAKLRGPVQLDDTKEFRMLTHVSAAHAIQAGTALVARTLPTTARGAIPANVARGLTRTIHSLIYSSFGNVGAMYTALTSGLTTYRYAWMSRPTFSTTHAAGASAALGLRYAPQLRFVPKSLRQRVGRLVTPKRLMCCRK